jgi:CheY-like chemotaxis protein
VFKSNYHVILTSSGEECIEKYIEETNRGNEISLILLEYRLRGMWRYAVARKIKEHNETKIILTSAHHIDDALVKELEKGNIYQNSYRN